MSSWRSTICVAAGFLALVATAARAQVAARQATPEEVVKSERGKSATVDVEVKNPMLLELDLIRSDGSSVFRGVKAEPGRPVSTYLTISTKKFVVDRARVEWVAVEQTRPATRKKPPQFLVRARVSSGWFRQDIDATVTLTDPDGEVLARGHWDDITTGNAAAASGLSTVTGLIVGIPRMLEVPFKPSPELHARLVEETRPVRLAIIVEIQGEEGDARDD
ncbi:MAG TPA: hypothetical protein VGC00_00600 [Thermoanaerobaculia bacterium]